MITPGEIYWNHLARFQPALPPWRSLSADEKLCQELSVVAVINWYEENVREKILPRD